MEQLYHIFGILPGMKRRGSMGIAVVNKNMWGLCRRFAPAQPPPYPFSRTAEPVPMTQRRKPPCHPGMLVLS